MSLDLQHMMPSGRSLGIGYLGFAEYRRLLARDAADIDLDTMTSFGGNQDWPSSETQPLVILLNHSDCDGWLCWGECEDLRPAMDAFVPPAPWPEWARNYHFRLAALVGKCADEGGIIRFH